MNAFLATYTPKKRNPETHAYEPDTDKSRRVLVVAILSQGVEEWESAVFIDSDRKLNSTTIDNITQCEIE